MQLSWFDRLRHQWTGWRHFVYPTPPALPPRPWHPDGDELFTRQPTGKLANSERIIAHMGRHGRLRIGTGDTRPATWDGSGTVDGYFLNAARASDPRYRIARVGEVAQPGLVIATAYGASPVGATVRYHDRMVRQGEPATSYSDNKVHIYDDVDGVATITEIQNFRGVTAGVLWCDGVIQYRLDIPSADTRGASAARYPLAESVLRYDDLMAGQVRRSTMGTPMASSTYVLPPALNTDTARIHPDNPAHLDPDAVPMGAVLKLKPEVAAHLQATSGRAPAQRRQLDAVLACYTGPGIIVVDTGGHHGTSLEPDPRWDQTELAPLRTLVLSDFEVWRD
jgi:hypothetical protein